ncbi:hypothetical protein M5689_000524 [Euphorbia peplus]|nr:hypothetical protein M5689_000524 [Euphorbia peplus]
MSCSSMLHNYVSSDSGDKSIGEQDAQLSTTIVHVAIESSLLPAVLIRKMILCFDCERVDLYMEKHLASSHYCSILNLKKEHVISLHRQDHNFWTDLRKHSSSDHNLGVDLPKHSSLDAKRHAGMLTSSSLPWITNTDVQYIHLMVLHIW